MTAYDDRQLDRALASWFESEASAEGAAVLLESSLAASARHQPRSAWRAALSDLPTVWTVGRHAGRRGAYLVAVGMLLAAIVIAAILIAGQRRPPAPPMGCVGDPPNLCGFGVGEWTSTTFLPGLSLTIPTAGWYTRDLPDRLEFRRLPMTSALVVQLDPQPLPGADADDAARRGTLDGLTGFLASQKVVEIPPGLAPSTASGLRIRRFDLATIPRPTVGLLVVPSDRSGNFPIEANHYAQRLYLLDLGDGHVASLLVIAFDSQRATLDGFDRSVRPIIDSIRPPPPSP